MLQAGAPGAARRLSAPPPQSLCCCCLFVIFHYANFPSSSTLSETFGLHLLLCTLEQAADGGMGGGQGEAGPKPRNYRQTVRVSGSFFECLLCLQLLLGGWLLQAYPGLCYLHLACLSLTSCVRCPRPTHCRSALTGCAGCA